MSSVIKRDLIHESYGRCCLEANFMDVFYDIFLKSSPEIAKYFTKTDFKKQKFLMKHGIAMMLMHSEGRTFAKATIERYGQYHSREGVEVPSNLYRYWLDSLIKTVEKLDPYFERELEKEWRRRMEESIRLMQAKY